MANDNKAFSARPSPVLDSNVLPHIIDTIIDHAPISSLRALRVSKGFRDLVNSHLAYHISVFKLRPKEGSPFSPMNRYEVYSHRGLLGSITYSPETEEIMRESYLRSARIVDISVPLMWASMVRALVRSCPDAAYRFMKRTDLSYLEFRKATVVIFGFEKPTFIDGFLAYGIEGLTGVDTLVVHIRAPGRRSLLGFNLNVKRLVVVLHPLNVSTESVSLVEEYLSTLPEDDSSTPRRRFRLTQAVLDHQLGILWNLLWAGYANGIPTTMVGAKFGKSLPSLPPQLRDLDLGE